MPRKIAQSTLNASTIDIINVIRENASYDYQQNVPTITTENQIREVGAIICGTPSFANQFINALVNRIASVRMQSLTFNNPYSILKKGLLEFGETIEDIFVGLAKAVDYSAEKAHAREFKRTLPDVRSVFHVMNWRVMYPITIQREDLKQAFLSISGVTSLITKIVEQVYTAAEYDEFLLFKYMLIKAVAKKSIGFVTSSGDTTTDAVTYRGLSNIMTFPSTKYNSAGVKNNSPKSRQVIFMDSLYNAQFDVEVLASAFNMEKADFMGRLFLIDNWTEFDNERFSVIRDNSDGIEEVTSEELEALTNVKAIILDENWFQIYDNNITMSEKYVASGLYWNYFYHTWKTISFSPFANAIAVVGEAVTAPDSITVKVASKDVSDIATVITFNSDDGVEFEQTPTLITDGIGVQKYGALLVPQGKIATDVTLKAMYMGAEYTATSTIKPSTVAVGATVTLEK